LAATEITQRPDCISFGKLDAVCFSLTSPPNARKLRGVGVEPNMSLLVSRRSLLRGAALVSGAGLFRLAASGQNSNGRRALALIEERYPIHAAKLAER